MTICSDCGGTVIEYDSAAGNGFCVKCGTVVEENTIVSEVTFGETSGGAAMVQGSYVGQGSTHARMSGPFGNRGSNESREQTIANASKKIQSIANILRLSEVVCLAATRLYTLAVEHKFTKGRKSLNVVAVCLYVACRQKETRNYMLIDFSDLLQVNVFELGHTYLQLIQTLNLRLPLVDPSHYISRFSALLEFGDETHKVAHDAVRLVQRFDRDWMTRGRRPAGICGAALLLAARMNNFRRSIEEIVQVVKIADTTLKKRLEEFKNTPSGSLTLADFRNVWLEEEMDPPAFTKGKEKESARVEGDEGVGAARSKSQGENAASKGAKSARKKGKRKRLEGQEAQGPDAEPPPAVAYNPTRPTIDRSLLTHGILASAFENLPLFLPESDPNLNIDPALLPISQNQTIPTPNTVPDFASPESETLLYPPDTSAVEETADLVLTEEVSNFLQNPQGSMLIGALDEAEHRRLAQIALGDELAGLDEDELDQFLLTEEEVKIKERVWVELNKDYLEALAAKAERQDSAGPSKSAKRRKTSVKARDSSTPHGATAAESVRNFIKKNPKYSKRINYDALKDLFVDGPFNLISMDEKDDGDLYTMGEDDKSDGEPMGMEIIDEEGGGIGMLGDRNEFDSRLPGFDDDAEVEKDGDPAVGWEDPYEQEV